MELAHAAAVGEVGGEDVVDQGVDVLAGNGELAHGDAAEEGKVGRVQVIEGGIGLYERLLGLRRLFHRQQVFRFLVHRCVRKGPVPYLRRS